MLEPAATESAERTVEDRSRLRGNVGTLQIFFTTLSYNAPLAISAGFIPALIAFGNGLGAPVAVLAVGVLTALFANGFVAMARRIPRPGGFYAYITASLSRPIGLAAGLLAFVAYLLATLGGVTYVGISVQSLISNTFGGPRIDWWLLSGMLLLVAAVIGYFRLDLSARVLMVILCAEIVLVMAYNIAVLATGGADGFDTSSFTLEAATSGSVGITLLFGILLFTGYEATVIFRDEARDPDTAIPRATHGFLAFVAVMYAFGSWVFIQGVGADTVVEQVSVDPTGTFLGSVEHYLGKTMVEITTLLLCTSTFAALLAAHTISSRYLFNLSADRIFPAWFGVRHHRLESPHRASIAISCICLASLTAIAIGVSDSATLYARLSGIASYIFLILMCAAAIGAVRFLLTTPEPFTAVAKHVVAVVIASAGYLTIIVLATMNFEVLVSGSKALGYTLVAAIWTVAALGVVLGLAYRRFRPAVYARIGRQ
ncbi:APC family permease [Nocardia pseudovaccinii]|uniref:APC family permease n=1 Tax=Nocardia pseudovaccinii TaxID=189540 RepID=UPI003D925873